MTDPEVMSFVLLSASSVITCRLSVAAHLLFFTPRQAEKLGFVAKIRICIATESLQARLGRNHGFKSGGMIPPDLSLLIPCKKTKTS